MARPRKDQNEPLATERIKTAFWCLIADYDFKDITIGMIAQKACCNRGTFYYHFQSTDELLSAIVEEELLGPHGLPRDLLLLSCYEERFCIDDFLVQRASRLGLLMQRAGQERIGLQVKSVVIDMWKAILCDGGDCLLPETHIAIEYLVSGIIGAVDHLYREDRLNRESLATVQQISRLFAQTIYVSQGITREELATRVTMFVRCLQLNEPDPAPAFA